MGARVPVRSYHKPDYHTARQPGSKPDPSDYEVRACHAALRACAAGRTVVRNSTTRHACTPPQVRERPGYQSTARRHALKSSLAGRSCSWQGELEVEACSSSSSAHHLKEQSGFGQFSG
mmetsp:Transcript_16060/g.28481  ORF Transcript_16060/g.28481 Transcript_16060/m.28481 type:complete len:119 (+) Transcript_16060:448-804(+)